jgi:signal transduction histidine kinase
VTVRDNGVGFADPALALLDGGKLAPGSGFGLFGIRRLIRARGGTILAETPTNGSGAAITFTLPGRFVEAPRLSARAGQN